MAQERYADALPYFSHALSLNEKLIEAYEFRAKCYEKLAEAEKNPQKKAELIAKSEADKQKVAELKKK